MSQSQTEGMLTMDRTIRFTRLKGIVMVLIAASLWGVSGTAAQVLFQRYYFDPGWLVTVRMGISGILLMVSSLFSNGTSKTFAVWKDRKDALGIVIFAVFGLVFVQYSYFASIHLSNAATATILQYLGPVLISIYVAIRLRRLPNRYETVAVLLAVVGTFLLVTNGQLGNLSISVGALIWGLLSAVALAFYTLYPGKLIRVYGSTAIVGWGMLLGSLLFSIYTHPWHIVGAWTTLSIELVVFVVLFGTLLPFFLYLESLRYITPSETSVLGCAEPLSSVIVALLLLHVTIGSFAMIGGICIITTVVILAKK